MTEHTSIRVTVAAKEAAAESKREDETWNDYLQRCTENPPEVREYVEAGGALPAEVREQLDRIERASTAAESTTGSIKNTLEDMGGR